jgi:lipopolysaccharide biosynthesis glycosyltransferase
MLNSLGSHAAPEAPIQAYCLDDGLSDDDKSKVTRSLPANIGLHWRQPGASLRGLPTWGRMTATTYQKLTLGEWIPEEIQRVIWLDCDLLVLHDLSGLWLAEMHDFVALAIQDQRVPMVSSRLGVASWRELGLPAESKYFNAGVLVIDLERWRAQEIGRRSLDYLAGHRKEIYFWDQEALNAMLSGKWGELDTRWNWHPSLDRLVAPKNRNPAYRSQTSEDRWIVHFSGNLKPWSFSGGGPWYALYQRYLDRTVWAGRRPAPRRRDAFLRWYETSSLRRLLYPIESWTTMAVRALTREYPE